MSSINYKTLSSGEVYDLKLRRWKARTDLQYLCKEILGYPDVCHEVHGPVLGIVQRFPLPTKENFQQNDVLLGGNWTYEPVCPLYELPHNKNWTGDERRVLILDPRGFLKSTINAISHTIQWIINYPDIRILLAAASAERAEGLVAEIKGHFQTNEVFRALFPEHCPQRRVFDWGTKAQFTSEARRINRKEETIMTCSIDKSATGYHFEVIKFSDIVDDRNSLTRSQLEGVIKQFGAMENLVDRPDSWIDVEGTRYDFADVYGKIVDDWLDRHKNKERQKWNIHVRACFKTETHGKPWKFTPDELSLPFAKDADGKRIPWWSRWNEASIESYKREHGQILTAAHKYNNPVAVDDDSKTPFPVNENYPKVISPQNFKRNVRVAYYKTTVDTAETQEEGSDFSVITTCAWDSYGRCYVVDVVRDKFLPNDLCTQIILAYTKYKPVSVLIEETGYVRGLMPTLRRFEDLSGSRLPFVFLKRDNQIVKEERILNTLQPWYKSGDLRFVSDLPEMPHVLQELIRFPKYKHNDILDTLADQFQDKSWFGREKARPTFEQYSGDEFEKMLGIEPQWVRKGLEETKELDFGPGAVL